MKVCTVCSIEKEDLNFSVIRRNPDGSIKYRNSWCNSCKKEKHNKKHGIESRKKKFESDTHKECTHCHNVLPKELFSVTKRNEDGSVKYVGSWCHSCKNELEIEKRGGRVKKIPLVQGNRKECLICCEIKDAEEFYSASNGRLGRASYCKECVKLRNEADENYREKHREYVKVYREKNLFSWRAMHRVHQFNRRSSIKANSDGTLVPELVKFIYSMSSCYWCKEEIPLEQRTLEHVQELSAGGAHSIFNVTMACNSCNSSRKGKSNGRD